MRYRPQAGLAGLALLLFTAGCGGGGAVGFEAPPPKFSSVTLSNDTVVVEAGLSVQVAATPRDENGLALSGFPPPVYTIEDPNVASVNAGIVTGTAPGTTRLFVEITQQGVTHGDTARVIVTPPGGPAPAHPVSTVGTSFAPALVTIAVGDSVTWLFSGATHNVTFVAAAPPGGNIPDQQPGARVSRSFTAPGSYPYDCTRHSGMTGTVNVQAGQASVFSSVVLTPPAASILVGGTIDLVAEPLDQNGVPMTGLPVPVFTPLNPAVASVSATGQVLGVSAGTALVAASITSGGTTHADTSTITVQAPAGGATVTTPNLTFLPNLVTVQVGETVTWQFSGAVHNVTFLVAVPPGFDIPDQPIGSAVQRTFASAGVFPYECTRHANMTGSVVVQSGQPQVFTSVSVSPVTTNLLVGGQVQLTATPLDQSGVPMTGLPPASFTTSNSAIATVSASGLVTAQGAGTASITASITSGGTTHSAIATVIVTVPAPGTVTVSTTGNNTFSPASVTLAAGGTVTWQFGNGTHNVTWIAAQPPGGNIPDQTAGTQSRTFPTPGTFDYQCTRHNGMTGTVTVTGSGSSVYTSLLVGPKTPFLVVNATVQLTATPLDQNNAPMTGLPAPTWNTRNPSVASVDPSGLVTGLAPGTAVIVATLTSGGITHSDSSTITVGTAPNATITTPGLQFSPDDVTIPPGGTVVWQFSGTTHNVTFETIAPPGGNIPNTAPGNSVARTFPQLGDYKYECTIHLGLLKGRIRVR